MMIIMWTVLSRRLLSAVILSTGAAVFLRDARAQDGAARAQALFDEALTLSDQGRWTEACPKFRESFAAAPGVGALLNVASCSAREGKPVAAAREYRQAIELNIATTDPERKRAVDAQARQALKALETRLGKITLRLSPPGIAARVSVDGAQTVPMSGPIEVEAGSHSVRVEADGFAPSDTTISVTSGQDAAVDVALTRGGGSSSASPARHASSGPSGLSVAGWVTGLVGATGLAGRVCRGASGGGARGMRSARRSSIVSEWQRDHRGRARVRG
jgi:hypothetical protein